MFRPFRLFRSGRGPGAHRPLYCSRFGLAVGLPSALALGRFVELRLYRVKAQDPTMAIAMVVVLSVVSATAGLIPARKASRIDPILALRYE